MRSARSVLPIDLPALVAHNGRLYPNEAWPRESVGSRSVALHPVETALEHWFSFGNGRSAWITSRQGRMAGFVSVRRRGGREAWEIDGLVDTTPGVDALPELLDRALVEAGRLGAGRLFARIASGSELLPVLRAAGFQPYSNETLYVAASRPAFAGQPQVQFRQFSRADLYPTFRLYCSIYPESRRRLEGATFSEWQAATESQWLKGGIHLVAADECNPAIQIRAARLNDTFSMELMLERPDVASVGAAVRAAVERSAADAPLSVLAHGDRALAGPLAALGFESRAEYISLVRRTTRVVSLPRAAQQVANTAVVT